MQKFLTFILQNVTEKKTMPYTCKSMIQEFHLQIKTKITILSNDHWGWTLETRV